MLMLRTSLFAIALSVVGCHRDPAPTLPAGELPPLPPASGTPVGYLVDNAIQLALTDDQLARLKQLDSSLSARNEGIATQIREIEKPEVEGPPDPKAPPTPPPNMAPGAQPIRTTVDAQKLHAARDANDQEALEKAFAVLDERQQVTARRLLADRGIASPKSVATPAPAPAPAGDGVPREP